jgi:hypothetical protein
MSWLPFEGATPEGVLGSVRVVLTHPHEVVPSIGTRIAYVRAGQSTLGQIQAQEICCGLSGRVHMSDIDQQRIATDDDRFDEG